MKIIDFEKELQEISPDLAINSASNGLANITYQGASVCAIPDTNIYDEPNDQYGLEINGRFIPHRGRNAALGIVKGTLKKLQNKDEADAFFGRGSYSDKNLSVELGTDIPIEVSATPVTPEALPEPK